MDIPDFDKLEVSNMVIIVQLSHDIDNNLAFHLLPITKMALPVVTGKNKCKLPHCSVPGSMISIRHRDKVRGLVTSTSNAFKNAVNIDISIARKNISVKLSGSNKMQMCGAKSLNDGIEAAQYIVEHLTRIQRILDSMNADPNLTQKTIDWVTEATCGPDVIVKQYETVGTGTIKLNVPKYTTMSSIVIPSDAEIPSDMNCDLARYLLQLAVDYEHHDMFKSKIDFLPNLSFVAPLDLKVSAAESATVNFNYSLGFEIDREALNEEIQNYGFDSRYNPAMRRYDVAIELPYTPDPNSIINREKKGKVPHHTLMVYRTGSVTQSGPNVELAKDVYYRFMSAISEIRPIIQYDKLPCAR